MMPPLCLREKSDSVEAGPQNYQGLKTHLAQGICVDAIRQEVQVNKLWVEQVHIFLGPNINHSAAVFCSFSIQLRAFFLHT